MIGQIAAGRSKLSMSLHQRPPTPDSSKLDSLICGGVFTLSHDAPVLTQFVEGLLETPLYKSHPEEIARLTILLPTRRAARVCTHFFLERSQRQSLLLPKILSLGDLPNQIEELLQHLYGTVSLEILEALNLPAPLPPLRARILYAEALRRAEGLFGAKIPPTPMQCFDLAGSLLRALDEISGALPLDQDGIGQINLKTLLPAAYATHWSKITQFLEVFQQIWPTILKAENASDPRFYLRTRLNLFAKILSESPPQYPIYIVGPKGLRREFFPFFKTLLDLPKGTLILDSLSQNLLNQINLESHPFSQASPFFEQGELLQHMDISRDCIRAWPVKSTQKLPHLSACQRLLEAAYAPQVFDHVLPEVEDLTQGIAHMAYYEAKSLEEEARFIALTLREVLETPGKTAALVTPVRALAQLVKNEMQRWNIALDDSAGTSFRETESGRFLILIAQMCSLTFSPITFLSLLRHPFTTLGYTRDALLSAVTHLELQFLRIPEYPSSFDKLVQRCANFPELAALLGRLERTLKPFKNAVEVRASLETLLKIELEVAVQLSKNPQDETSFFWQAQSSEVRQMLQELPRACAGSQPISVHEYPGFLDSLLGTLSLQLETREHPRLALFGLMESRLLSRDLVILGGLNEGSWPSQTIADPWLNTKIRIVLGLSTPEHVIGQDAQDFMAAFRTPEVLLTRSQRVGARAERPSRFLTVLENSLEARGAALRRASRNLLDMLEKPIPLESPSMPPAPCPPVHMRPKTFSVTGVGQWMQDPYAFYARHMLFLKPLLPLEAQPSEADFGSLVHKLLEKYLLNPPSDLEDFLEKAYQSSIFDNLSPIELRDWRIRIEFIFKYFKALNDARLQAHPTRIFPEAEGSIVLETDLGSFSLKGRIDRLEYTSEGQFIFDYKTGSIPTLKNIQNGKSPQLPLLGLIAKRCGFGGFSDLRNAGELSVIYWALLVDRPEEALIFLPNVEDLIAQAQEGLHNLLHAFYDPEMPAAYEARTDTRSDYAHLARTEEWAGPQDLLSSDGGEEG